MAIRFLLNNAGDFLLNEAGEFIILGGEASLFSGSETGRFRHFDISNQLACQTVGWKRYATFIPDESFSANDRRSVEDQEHLTWSFARVHKDGRARTFADEDGVERPIIERLRPGRVVRSVWENDAIIDEWRIASVLSGRGLGGLITVTCVPIWFDLVERSQSSMGAGLVSEVHDGERIFVFEIAEQAASSIFLNYLKPHAPTWVDIGNVHPSVVIPALSVDHFTPWALGLATRDALRAMDVPCELHLRPTLTSYKLDLVQQIGANANIPIFHPSASLISLRRREDAALQRTRTFVRGGADPNGFPGVLGRARWKGVAV